MPILSDLHFEERTPTILRTGARDLLSKPLANVAPCKIVSGDWSSLPSTVATWVSEKVSLCQPKDMHIMTGTLEEDAKLKAMLVDQGVLHKLPKYDNCFLARTDPKDVARVESRTFICTEEKGDAIPIARDGVKGTLGNWMAPKAIDEKVQNLFPRCMKGRTMYVIPYSMGPIGGPLSKNGIEVTDSAYVAVSMRVMTRVGTSVFDCIRKDKGIFVKCLHSVGQPLKDGEKGALWPCNPEEVIIAHKPDTAEIISFGSGYGGNSLLGKKCFALRIGSALARKQGWLAEHMLIMGIKKEGESKRQYIAAAFPSACGKTNLAMLRPTLPGYEITCVGDDIAWLRFDDATGELRAINPENGFFGVAPGTSRASNPVAMDTVFKDTVFTNVAATDDGGVWWEGMTSEAPDHLTDWTGKEWSKDCGRKAAHPNSRFCSPAANCPILDQDWENPAGVKIDAILFGGRRPEGVPLVAEANSWQHAVFMGAGLKSEATAAAEHKGKCLMHDSFSMRPFFGLPASQYFSHWLSMEREGRKMPNVFMVNWFRKSSQSGKFLWPGFGDNIRVMDWILRRCDGEEDIAVPSAVGNLPKKGSMNLEGLEEDIDWEELFSLPKSFWKDECDELEKWFDDQLGDGLPVEVAQQLKQLRKRIDDL